MPWIMHQDMEPISNPQEIFVGTDDNGYVKTSQWMPKHEPLKYPPEFIAWINSINRGWRNMVKYKPFELYCKQAEQWLSEKDDITNYYDEDDQEDYILQEHIRCRDNTLYFADKYGWLKEGNADGGRVKYKAWKAQKVLLFLMDCGYNLLIGKGRQIGFTSTMGLAACKRINFNKSYFIKFVTHTQDKGEEIFNDKIKWAFSQIPPWFAHNAYNDAHNKLSLMEKSGKGTIGGIDSRIQVIAPAVDAINGGSPNLTMIDEIGLFTIFGEMMSEGRPTLFAYDPATGKQIMKRQLIAWGTGGQMDKGGASFEVEFKAALDAWRNKDYDYAIIPLFFDAFAREGVTQETYDNEKRNYYAKGAKFKVQFHQHYPITIDDMFLRSAKTIIPIAECNAHLLRIYNLPLDQKPQYGYFEPVFDRSRPLGEGALLPYKVVGATWIPTNGMEDDRTTAVVFEHPPYGEKWQYRYYQGTDPINSETGHSKMSSSIWDAQHNTISSVVFYRTSQFKDCYLQCLLQGLYYDQTNTGGVKELIESNIGQMYADFQEQMGYGRRLVANAALPEYMQTPGGTWWGINNRANTAGRIANKIIEMIDVYQNNIFIEWIFVQLKTFVEKDLKGQNIMRQTRYQADDLRRDYDDAIFSAVFAYINAQAHLRWTPEKIEHGDMRRRYFKYVQNAETNFRIRRAEVDEKGKVIRFLGHGD